VDESGGAERTTIVVTHDKDLLYRLKPRVVMLHDGRVSFDGPFEAFEAAAATSPIIRPYFELMPVLHRRKD
jgi:phospholipid/cholesterol/gamma-HCH transport system ATP-binding protein